MKKGFILILGGARSGKSDYALSLGETLGKKRLYLATAEPRDEEMKERIKAHQEKRGEKWETIEEPFKISKVLEKRGGNFEVVLIDCLTLWASNLWEKFSFSNQEIIFKEVEKLVDICSDYPGQLILISNEVGMGIVPENRSARLFRDLLGRINQIIANKAERVYLLVAGIPCKIK